ERLIGRFVSNGNEGQKICPKCHLPLPHATAQGELDPKTIAIVGARSSGKSNYFAVLLNELEQRYSEELSFTMLGQNTFSVREGKPVSSHKLYRIRYGESLFGEQNRIVPATLSAAAQADIRIPLIYRLLFNKRPIDRVLRPMADFTAMDVVIFDAAGEDLEDPTILDHFYRYITCAAGIIFIIDPTQFAGVRQQLSEETRAKLPQVQAGARDVVDALFQLLQRRGQRIDRRFRVPVAITLAKSDVLDSILPAGSPLRRDSDHSQGFDDADCDLVSEEVKSRLRQWDSAALIMHANSFKNHRFFAVSALGDIPDGDRLEGGIEPRRVGDPLLWILWKLGYISARPTR
ncbi:MAG: hypothetical protein MI861_07905, partial [Pirellulales bacterium]|nr:hypothetical protein [Pirellulales bacterium]